MKNTKVYLIIVSSLFILAIVLAVVIWFVVTDLEESKKQIETQEYFEIDTSIETKAQAQE